MAQSIGQPLLVDPLKVFAAIHALKHQCTAEQVALHIGSEDIAAVEDVLRETLVDARGTYEVVNDGQQVVYSFPTNFESKLFQNKWKLRVWRFVNNSWPVLFYLFRMVFGVVLVFIVIAVIVAILVILMSSQGERRGGGGSNVGVHHVTRVFAGHSHYHANPCETFWYMFWYNPFFRFYYLDALYNPYFYSYRSYYHPTNIQDGQGRVYMVGVDGRLREVPVASHAEESPRNQPRPARPALTGLPTRSDGGGDDENRLGIFEAVFSFLFGDGNPGPSEAQQWGLVASVIRKNRGVVVGEQILPFLHPDAQSRNNHATEGYMGDVLARLKGRPIPTPKGLLVYKFDLLGKGVTVEHQEEYAESLPTHLEENEYKFSAATETQVKGIIAVVLFCIFSLLWLHYKLIALGDGTLEQFLASRNIRGSIGKLAVKTVFVAYPFFIWYCVSFLVIPAVRYMWIKYANIAIGVRNLERKRLYHDLESSRKLAHSDVNVKMEFCKKVAEREGI